MNAGTKKIISWIFAILLALLFLFGGIGKLMAVDEVVTNYEMWGLPLWLMYFVGACEILGGIGLLLPKTRALAAIGLIGIMIGAVATHALASEFTSIILNTIIIALLYMLVRLRN